MLIVGIMVLIKIWYIAICNFGERGEGTESEGFEPICIHILSFICWIIKFLHVLKGIYYIQHLFDEWYNTWDQVIKFGIKFLRAFFFKF